MVKHDEKQRERWRIQKRRQRLSPENVKLRKDRLDFWYTGSKLTKTERLAYMRLLKLGLEPSRTTPYEEGVGVPDFKCKNSIWVEVKHCGASSNGFEMSIKQTEYFKKILEDGGQVLLFIYNKKYELNILSLKLGEF